MLDPVFAPVLVLLIVALVAVEVVGARRTAKGDTITELWRYVDKKLAMLQVARWFFRVVTAGVLIWAVVHLLAGAA